jgi:glycosyltransferase involved in cell wall biosynthesis
VGVDVHEADPERFRKKNHLERPYLLYVGRIEPGKGVGDLLKAYRALRSRMENPPDLVLCGALHMTLHGEGVRYVGRVPDQDKYDALAGAEAVVVPSRYESLSLLALEGFAYGAPVIANGLSEVLGGQVERSGGGATFTDEDSFCEAVRKVGEQRSVLSRKGKAFARRHTWEKVVDAYREELARIMEETPE